MADQPPRPIFYFLVFFDLPINMGLLENDTFKNKGAAKEIRTFLDALSGRKNVYWKRASA